MTERQINNVVETTLIEKKIKDPNYIRYSFYEINVKYPNEYGIVKQDLGMFLQHLRKRLKDENYRIYTEGQKFEYDNAKRVVESKQEYTNDDKKYIFRQVSEFIMSHSSKNGDIGRLQNEYESIFRVVNVT